MTVDLRIALVLIVAATRPGEPEAGDNIGLRVVAKKTLVYAAACARVRPFECDVLIGAFCCVPP